jgi:glyoxylase-like metal-dependent hydrolase (beta-lactamase superfamily II)
MHSVSPSLRRSSSAIRSSIREVHPAESRDQSRRVGVMGRKLRELVADLVERQPDALCKDDEGDPAEHRPGIAPVARARPLGAERAFPTRTVADGERLELGDASFTVLDLGPSESPHDSIWFLGDDRRTVFLGDQVYDRKHAYLADGFFEEWLRNLQRLPEQLPPDATLHVGHGRAVTPARFEPQREYIETFVEAVRTADWSQPDTARAAVVERMTRLLPTDELQLTPLLSSSARCTRRTRVRRVGPRDRDHQGQRGPCRDRR